ncbi:unnamed protein product [Diatraea saccharalis]|uniref:HAT C-terminal dimerisation domain-containing protein n=1 Tax=Diatraea saccharalis TaxID=40085 RepID=A0A9N9QZJ7_9NEOP|nr:unnamed protein product [Diatraea saccharalis]
MYLGVSTQESIIEIEKEIPAPKTQITDFRKSCLPFYIEAIKQITQRFIFSDPLYDIIELVTDPQKAQSFETKDLTFVVNRFPYLRNDLDLEELNKEWKMHALLDFTHLNLSPNLEILDYWNNVFRLKKSSGEPQFPCLKKVIIMLLLVLPFSNASVERVFSQLKLIKSDHRNRLATETISALMATKANIPNAMTFEPTKLMLKTRIKYKKDGESEEGTN